MTNNASHSSLFEQALNGLSGLKSRLVLPNTTEIIKTQMGDVMEQRRISLEKDYAQYCARAFVYGKRQGNKKLQGRAVQLLTEHIAEKGDEPAILLEYSTALLEYGRYSTKRLERENEELSQRLEQFKKSAALGDKFRGGQSHTLQAKQKRSFIEYIQKEQITLERISDLKQHMGGITRAVSGIEEISDTVLKGWYKEAMPHIKLKHGRPSVKK